MNKMENLELTLSPDEINQIKASREFFNKEYTRLKGDLKSVMLTVQGRRLVEWIIRISKPYQDHFTSDTHQTAHNLGKSYVGIQLHNLLQTACPELHQKMINEFRSRLTDKKGQT